MISDELAKALVGLPFPRKLYTLASSPEVVSIEWAQNGNTVRIDSIIIKNECFNPHVFNVKSNQHVLRQLSYYNFEKIDQKSRIWEFRHPFFIEGRRDLLHLVTRQSQKQMRNQIKPTGRRIRRRSKSIYDQLRANLMTMERESYETINMEIFCQDSEINSTPKFKNNLTQAKQDDEQKINSTQSALIEMTLSGTQEDNRDVMLKDTQGDAVTSNLNEVFPPLENIQTSNLRFHDRIITRSQIRKKNIDIFQLQSGSNSTPNGINGNFNGPAENSSPPKVCSTSDCMNGVLTTNSNSHFIVESRTGHILVENPSNKIYIKPNNKNAFIELSIENGSVYQYSGRKRVRDEVCRFSSTDNLMLDCRLVNEYFVEIESRSNTCLPVKVAVLKKGCNNEQKEIDNYFVIKRKGNIPSYNDYGAFENHILGNNRDDDCRFKQNEESFAKNSEGIHEVISFNAPEQYSANYSSPTSCFPFTREMTVKNEQKSQSEMHPSEFISNDYPYLKSFPPDSFTKIESEPLQSFNKYSFENIQTKGQDLQSNTAKWNPSVDIIASDPITQILTDFNSKQFNNDQQITNPLLDRQEKTEHVNLDHNYTIKSSQNLQFDLNNCSQTIQYDTNENKEYTELRSRSLPLSTTSCPEIGMYDSQPSIADIEKFQQLAANSEASDIRKLNDILSNRMISNEPLKNNTDLNSSENKYANSANNEGGYVDSQFPTCSTSDPYSILSDLEGIHLDDIFIIRDDNQNWYQERKLIMNEENYNNMFASVPFRIKTEKPDF